MAKRKSSTAVAVRTVTVRSPRRRRHNGNGRFGMGGRIPIAVLLGLAPGVSKVWQSRNNGASGPDGWGDVALRSYTGISPSNAYGKGNFSLYWMQFGLLPLVAGLAVHGLANRYGLNNFVRRMIPILEI